MHILAVACRKNARPLPLYTSWLAQESADNVIITFITFITWTWGGSDESAPTQHLPEQSGRRICPLFSAPCPDNSAGWQTSFNDIGMTSSKDVHKISPSISRGNFQQASFDTTEFFMCLNTKELCQTLLHAVSGWTRCSLIGCIDTRSLYVCHRGHWNTPAYFLFP